MLTTANMNDRSDWGYISEAINEGLYPFRPKEVTLVLQNNLWSPKLTILFSNFPSLTFTVDLPMNKLMSSEEYQDWIAYRCNTLLKERIRVEPESHIELGEN